MCEYPWTNRDVFQYVNDCHIYSPIFTFFMVLNVVFASIAFLYALHEFFKRSRKNIPIVCLCNEFLFAVSYLWCLGANETFANGNYALNLIYGMSRGGFYVTINLFTLRNVEVLLVIDKIQPEHDSYLKFFQFVMTHVIVFVSVPIESLAITLPIAFPQLSLANIIFYASMALITLTSPISWLYLSKLRKNLSQMKTSRGVYDVVEKKLSRLLIVGYWGYLGGLVPQLFLLYIPVFHKNMYIVYNISVLLAHISTCRILRATSRDETQAPSSPSRTSPLITSPTSTLDSSSVSSRHPSVSPTSNPTDANLEMEVLQLENPRKQYTWLDLDLTGKMEINQKENTTEGMTVLDSALVTEKAISNEQELQFDVC